jgi:hypothetical protein
MEISKKYMAPAKAKTRKLYSASEMIQQKKHKRLMAAEPERVAPDVLPKITSNLSKNDISELFVFYHLITCHFQ